MTSSMATDELYRSLDSLCQETFICNSNVLLNRLCPNTTQEPLRHVCCAGSRLFSLPTSGMQRLEAARERSTSAPVPTAAGYSRSPTLSSESRLKEKLDLSCQTLLLAPVKKPCAKSCWCVDVYPPEY